MLSSRRCDTRRKGFTLFPIPEHDLGMVATVCSVRYLNIPHTEMDVKEVANKLQSEQLCVVMAKGLSGK